MSPKKFRKNWLCLILVFSMILMMIAPVGAAVPVERQTMLVGFHNFPGAAEHRLLKGVGAQITSEFSIIPTVEVVLPVKAINGLSRNPLVDYIEPNIEFYAIAQTIDWGVTRVKAPEVWSQSQGSGIVVAVLDTGVGPHTDLPVPVKATNTIDDSGNNDGNGHGTHVAGTITALNNDYGVVGIAPQIDLYSAKVLNASGSGNATSIAKGIEWAVQQGANIINMSLGSSSSSLTIENACNEAYRQGVLLVAAAGNSGNKPGSGDNVGYPAKYESVIAVAATDSMDKRASFSSTGPAVELSAPGVSILSTYKNGYAYASGTSMASPHVAGVAALVWSSNSDLTNITLRSTLQNTAQDLGLPQAHQGLGLVRADLAVSAETKPVPSESPDPEPAVNVVLTFEQDTVTEGEGGAATLTVVVTNEFGNAVDELATDAFETYLDNEVINSVIFNETSAAGTYLGRLIVSAEMEAGEYTIKVVVTSEGVSGEDTATLTVDAPPPEMPGEPNSGAVLIESIIYATNGGKNNDRHLTVTVSLKDGEENPVAGASVSISLYLNGNQLSTGTDTTGLNGAVSFALNNAPSGTYTTVITGINAGELNWDGETPENSYTK